MFSLMESTQRKAVLIPFRITTSGGTPTLSEGSSMLTLTDGGVGIYQLDFGGTRGLGASSRIPVVLAAPLVATTDELVANVVEASLTVSTIIIEVNDDAGTATDASVHGIIVWFGSADEQ